MYSTGQLEIAGYRGRPLSNQFFKQDGPTGSLAVVFPGFRYRCDGSLLYYPTKALLALGADVLWAEYAYDVQPEYPTLEQRQRREWLFTDSLAAMRAGLKQRQYRRVTLVGKSLGTLAMGHVLAVEPLPQPRAIWLTPLLTETELRGELESAAVPSLFVIGSADPYFDAELLGRLGEKPGTEVLVLQGADHMLEAGDDAGRSIENLRRVVDSVQSFVGK